MLEQLAQGVDINFQNNVRHICVPLPTAVLLASFKNWISVDSPCSLRLSLFRLIKHFFADFPHRLFSFYIGGERARRISPSTNTGWIHGADSSRAIRSNRMRASASRGRR
jgi:hypothetical protein